VKVEKESTLTQEEGKVCTDCKQAKPFTEFYSKGKRLESFCKVCSKNRRKLRYAKKTKSEAQKLKSRKKTKVINIKSFKVKDVGVPSDESIQNLMEAIMKEKL
jgi:predicted sulfurtransferase